MEANHGGGYSYRLCKIPEEGKSGLTEECFQKTPLFFASNEQWAQTGYDESTRIYFTAISQHQHILYNQNIYLLCNYNIQSYRRC